IHFLKSPTTNDAEEAQLQDSIDEVSRLVLEPVAAKLQTSRLIVIPDGALEYVPFQILKTTATANDPLISRFDIVAAPSASALTIVKRQRMNRQPGNRLLVGFGDARFSAEHSPGTSGDGTSNARSDVVSR